MNLSTVISGAVCSLLRPLVRILLRNNIPFTTFADLAKWVYVRVALEDFPLPVRKQSISRVALLTGLTRKEVLRVKRHVTPGDPVISEKQNRAARVVSGWVRDPLFHDTEKQPAILPFDGEKKSSFTALVRTFSGDIPPRAILDELVRVGVVGVGVVLVVVVLIPSHPAIIDETTRSVAMKRWSAVAPRLNTAHTTR